VNNVSRWVFARNGNAVVSFVLGLVGLVGFGVILGPVAVGLGLMARQQIAERPRPGTWLALAGIVLGVVAFVYPIVRYARG
jgi:hypothetical protein